MYTNLELCHLKGKLPLSQTSPGFYVSAVQVFENTEKLLATNNFSFSHSVCTLLDTFQPFSSNLTLSSAKSLSLEESKIYRLGKGYNRYHKTSKPLEKKSTN